MYGRSAVNREQKRVNLSTEEVPSIECKTWYIYVLKKCPQQRVKQGIFMY